jgi:hypothetical protein
MFTEDQQRLIALNTHEPGALIDQLTPEQREELMKSYEESFDPKNLIGHEEVMKQHAKWLKPDGQ